MMKKLILILLVLPCICSAQEVPAGKSKLSVGISFAPEYSYRNLKAVDAPGRHLKSLSEEDDKGKFGFTTGVNLDYQAAGWFSFETGMLFTNKGYREVRCLRENQDQAVPFEAVLKYNFNYLEVPLNAKFYFAEAAGFRYFASAGLVPNVFLSRRVVSKIDGFKDEYIYPDGSVRFNSVNLSGTVGLGFKYDINPDFFLETTARYKHSFTTMNDAPLKRFLYSFGLNLTVYYRL